MCLFKFELGTWLFKSLKGQPENPTLFKREAQVTHEKPDLIFVRLSQERKVRRRRFER